MSDSLMPFRVDYITVQLSVRVLERSGYPRLESLVFLDTLADYCPRLPIIFSSVPRALASLGALG